MAKKLKFNLIVDGVRCKNVEDIQNNFNILDLIEYFKNGKLIKWAKVRDLDDLIQEIENIQSDDNLEIAKKLCKIFEIECDEEELNEELSLQSAEKIANGGDIDKSILDKLIKIDKLDLDLRIMKLNHNYLESGVFIDIQNNIMIFDYKLKLDISNYISRFDSNLFLSMLKKELSQKIDLFTELEGWRLPSNKELVTIYLHYKSRLNIFKNTTDDIFDKNEYIIENGVIDTNSFSYILNNEVKLTLRSSGISFEEELSIGKNRIQNIVNNLYLTTLEMDKSYNVFLIRNINDIEEEVKILEKKYTYNHTQNNLNNSLSIEKNKDEMLSELLNKFPDMNEKMIKELICNFDLDACQNSNNNNIDITPLKTHLKFEELSNKELEDKLNKLELCLQRARQNNNF